MVATDEVLQYYPTLAVDQAPKQINKLSYKSQMQILLQDLIGLG
jgi:hypothetical protein